jgi:hypothetical protein
MLQLLRYDPGAYRRWPSTAPEERCFDAMCDHVGRAAAVRLILRAAARGGDHDGKLARVVVKPKDKDAANPVQARNRDNAQAQRSAAEDSKRRIGEALLGIMEAEGAGPERAVRIYRYRLKEAKKPDVSRARCYESLALARGEREGGAA